MATVTRWSAAVMGIVLGAAALSTAQAPRPGETRTTWEYHTETVRGPAGPAGDSRRQADGAAETMLNSWGRNGWELVGVTRREVRSGDTLESETYFAFKRPIGAANR